jgi:high affinity Mn2+ porin
MHAKFARRSRMPIHPKTHSGSRALSTFTATLLCGTLLFWPVLSRAQGTAPAPQPQGTPVTPDQAGPAPTEWYAYHGQSTFTEQFSPGFASKVQGPQSLSSAANGRETVDATAYLGVRPWTGAEVWFDPEVDQGFGLGNTFGVAGFTSGEAYKLGASEPYFEIPRLFLRQTINLSGETERLDPDLNQLAGTQTADRLVITAGKFSVVDIFDTNKYANNPRNDFLNWSVINQGSFDYAANSWGYTYGAAAELYLDRWALRVGAFNLPNSPNGENVDPRILGQFQLLAELEERHTLWSQPGKLKFLYWLDRGELGSYDDAIALGRATGQVPSTANVRSYKSKDGVELNVEQQIAPDLGLFIRAGASQGSVEEDAFTDINKSVSGGLSLAGPRWGRPNDTIGLATAINMISHQGKQYLAAGGLGGIIGDGQLLNAGPEQIVETYYSYAVLSFAHVTGDYQFINNPAYNRDRGPVSALGLRLHAQF